MSAYYTNLVGTISGNLKLAPAGASIDVGGKSIINTESATATTFLSSALSADSTNRLRITNTGDHEWSTGSAAADVFLTKGATNTLRIGKTATDDEGILGCATVAATNTTSTTLLLRNTTTGNNTADPFGIESDGQESWGPFSSNGAKDTFLYRSAASTLSLTTGSRGATGATLRVANIYGFADPIKIACVGSSTANAVMASVSSTTIGIASYSASIACGPNGTNTNDGTQCNTLISCNNGCNISNTNSISVIAGCDACTVSAIGSGNNGSVILGSTSCTISGVSARCSILGGRTVALSGCTSVIAMGRSISVSGRGGNLVLSDAAGTNTFGTGIGTDNSLEARFQGGVYFKSNADGSAGINLNAGANSWASGSDARIKSIMRVAPHDDALTALKSMDIYHWKHLDAKEDSTHSVGPTSQEFYGAFGGLLGKDAPKTKFHTAKCSITGNRTSKCAIEEGDDLWLLDERDEKSAMWLVIKRLTEKVEALEAQIASKP